MSHKHERPSMFQARQSSRRNPHRGLSFECLETRALLSMATLWSTLPSSAQVSSNHTNTSSATNHLPSALGLNPSKKPVDGGLGDELFGTPGPSASPTDGPTGGNNGTATQPSNASNAPSQTSGDAPAPTPPSATPALPTQPASDNTPPNQPSNASAPPSSGGAAPSQQADATPQPVPASNGQVPAGQASNPSIQPSTAAAAPAPNATNQQASAQQSGGTKPCDVGPSKSPVAISADASGTPATEAPFDSSANLPWIVPQVISVNSTIYVQPDPASEIQPKAFSTDGSVHPVDVILVAQLTAQPSTAQEPLQGTAASINPDSSNSWLRAVEASRSPVETLHVGKNAITPPQDSSAVKISLEPGEQGGAESVAASSAHPTATSGEVTGNKPTVPTMQSTPVAAHNAVAGAQHGPTGIQNGEIDATAPRESSTTAVTPGSLVASNPESDSPTHDAQVANLSPQAAVGIPSPHGDPATRFSGTLASDQPRSMSSAAVDRIYVAAGESVPACVEAPSTATAAVDQLPTSAVSAIYAAASQRAKRLVSMSAYTTTPHVRQVALSLPTASRTGGLVARPAADSPVPALTGTILGTGLRQSWILALPAAILGGRFWMRGRRDPNSAQQQRRMLRQLRRDQQRVETDDPSQHNTRAVALSQLALSDQFHYAAARSQEQAMDGDAL